MCRGSAAEGRVATEADAGSCEHKAHGGQGDDSDVPSQLRQGCVVESGNHAKPGVQRQCERQRQQAEFNLTTWATELAWNQWSGEPRR